MKEFEKWKDNGCRKVCNLTNIGVCGDCTGIGSKEDAWRAALEWVLENTDGSCGVRRCVPMEAIRDELDYEEEKQELA